MERENPTRGPYGEHTTVVFVPISADTGLDKLHPTWAGTIAPAHKRAQSVDTGKATQQQPGPPIKLSKSRSVENFAAIDMRAPSPDATGNFEDEVDLTLVGQNRRVPTQLSEKK